MQELSPENFFLAAPLFAEIPHHRVIAFSVLERSCPGRVFVDDPGAPRTAFISSITEFFCFGGDALNQGFNCSIREQVIPGLVEQMGSVALSGPTPEWQMAIDQILAGYPGGWAQRAEFDFPEENLAAVNGWQRRVPPGLRVEAYTRETAALFEEIEPFWNGIDSFLERGFGYSAFRNAELLSHCHTVAVGGGLAEISVETQLACRRQGLARLVVSAFIQHSLTLALRPHWTCWRNNLPSVALAQKLGFVHRVDAPVRYVQPGG